MKGWKIAALVILGILVGIQWIPTNLNQGDTDVTQDFLALYSPPARVGTLFKTACYDCHSNHTHYPWYNEVQPVALYLESHIEEGKKELNFSEFGSYSPRRLKSKLKSIASQVKGGEMPLTSYVWIHHDADLTQNERKAIVAWVEQLQERI